MARFLARIGNTQYVVSNHKIVKLNYSKYYQALIELDIKCKMLNNYDKLEKLLSNAGEIYYPKNYLNNPDMFDL